MSIISGIGLGSGLDINNIVKTLVEAEGSAKSNSINRRENDATVRLSALSKLKASLDEFQKAYKNLQSSSTFSKFSTVSSNDEVLTATAGSKASTGQYQIEVVQLATRHALISDGFADSSQPVGKGTLSISSGDTTFNVTIDDSNNTLTGLKDAINQHGDNTGIQASIIHVDDGLGGTVAKMVLRSADTGQDNALVLSATEDGTSPGLSNFEYDVDGSGITNLSEQTSAQDAVINIDGQTASRASNHLDDVIEGLTIHVGKAQVGTEIQLTVGLDKDAIQEDVKAFVSKYNALIGVMDGLNKVTPEGRQNGPMVGDSLLRNLNSQVRRAFGETVASAPQDANTLNMVGISIDRYGHMALDESTMTSMLDTHLSGITTLFTANDGVVSKLHERIEPYLMSGGILEQQTQSLNSRLKSLADEQSLLDKRLEKVEERLTKQFIAMDTIVGQLQSTSAFLTQQLTNL